jgi:hypothetical protein
MPATTLVAPAADGGVVPAGCSSCSGGLLGAPGPNLGPVGCDGCCGGNCYPGRKPCDCCCDSNSRCGRFFCGLYECVCCPDPCYEPHWEALADAAFFQDAPRPVTQMRLRFDNVWNYPFPDKAEYLWARADGRGAGPKPPAGVLGEKRVEYRDISLYNEVGIGRFSTWMELPYRHVEPETFNGASGIADLVIGTKSLLLDCELLQVTFGFNTHVPTGNFTKGLGVNHVSLEPTLLMALKLTPTTYLQGEAAYWFPIGGDQTYEGPIFHYHLSLNHLLWCCGTGIKVVGNVELNGYEIMGGAFTDPFTGQPRSAKDVGDILSVGPGIRLIFCDKIDVGLGSAFKVTADSMGEEFLRAEFRWRF